MLKWSLFLVFDNFADNDQSLLILVSHLEIILFSQLEILLIKIQKKRLKAYNEMKLNII